MDAPTPAVFPPAAAAIPALLPATLGTGENEVGTDAFPVRATVGDRLELVGIPVVGIGEDTRLTAVVLMDQPPKYRSKQNPPGYVPVGTTYCLHLSIGESGRTVSSM